MRACCCACAGMRTQTRTWVCMCMCHVHADAHAHACIGARVCLHMLPFTPPNTLQNHSNALPSHPRRSRALLAVLDMCGRAEACAATLAALAATPGAVSTLLGLLLSCNWEDDSFCTVAQATAAILAHMLGDEGASRAVLAEPRAIEAMICGMGNRRHAEWAIAALARAAARDSRAAAEVVRLWAPGAIGSILHYGGDYEYEEDAEDAEGYWYEHGSDRLPCALLDSLVDALGDADRPEAVAVLASAAAALAGERDCFPQVPPCKGFLHLRPGL